MNFEAKIYDEDKNSFICFHHAVIKVNEAEKLGILANFSMEVDSWGYDGNDFRNTSCYVCDGRGMFTCPWCGCSASESMGEKDLDRARVGNNTFTYSCKRCEEPIEAKYDFVGGENAIIQSLDCSQFEDIE